MGQLRNIYCKHRRKDVNSMLNNLAYAFKLLIYKAIIFSK